MLGVQVHSELPNFYSDLLKKQLVDPNPVPSDNNQVFT